MDTPELSFDEAYGETADDLWTLRQALPVQSYGSDDLYQPPARFYLPKLAKARALIEEAAQLALGEIPEKLREHARQYVRRHGPSWSELARKEPEMRRYWQVSVARELIDGLIDDLTNEGRPRPAPDLSLGKVRRTA